MSYSNRKISSSRNLTDAWMQIKRTRLRRYLSGAHLLTVTVAPMTSKSFAAPFRVPVTHAGTKGLIVLDQIRTVDKIRVVKRLGAVTAKTLSAVLTTLQEVFAE